MPIYYFNIEDGQAPIPCNGAELKNLSAAKCEAVKMMGRLICDAGEGFWNDAEWRMTVSDENRLTLFQLHFLGTESPALKTAA
jgi:hypothetical protein